MNKSWTVQVAYVKSLYISMDLTSQLKIQTIPFKNLGPMIAVDTVTC